MDLIDFLATKARGLILTITGTGAGMLPEAIPNNIYRATGVLHPLQEAVLFLTGVVAILTIISYMYKFFKFCRDYKKKK